MTTIKHKAVVLSINQLHRDGMCACELYETTRGVWRVGERRNKAEYAIATVQGVAVEVYRIRGWHKPGTLKYKLRDISQWRSDNHRWEFEGEVAEENIRRLYVGKFVGKNGQNPVRYANI